MKLFSWRIDSWLSGRIGWRATIGAIGRIAIRFVVVRSSLVADINSIKCRQRLIKPASTEIIRRLSVDGIEKCMPKVFRVNPLCVRVDIHRLGLTSGNDSI